jgi:Ca-activated chloride channel family protein
LNELRKSAPGDMNEELVDEVTYLAKRYGIITPYTSYLMADDLAASGPAGNTLGGGAAGFGLGGRSSFLKRFDAFRTPAVSAGEKARQVNAAKETSDLRRKQDKGGLAAFDYQAQLEYERQGKTGSVLQAVRYIGSKTFYQRGVEWQESAFDSGKIKNVQTVTIGSDEYVKLLLANTSTAKYLALGDAVMKIKGQWYRFEESKTAKKKG